MKKTAFLITGLSEQLALEDWEERFGAGLRGQPPRVVARWSAGAGKDTVAEIIAGEDRSRVVIALADPIKRIVAEVYDLSVEQVWGDRKHEPLEGLPLGDGSTGALLTSRHAQVKLGTEWGRECSEHTWTRYLCRVVRNLVTVSDVAYRRYAGCLQYSALAVRPTTFIIPDVRFRSELAYLREHLAPLVDQVVTVRVRRRTTSPPPASLDIHHRSESDLVDLGDERFDWVIDNNGSLIELYHRVRAELPRWS